MIYIPNSNSSKTFTLYKKIIREFKNLGFKIEISSNLKIANFLDIAFDLNNNTYKPFNKINAYPHISMSILTTLEVLLNRFLLQ